jgi:FAD/FMN-containing dehydrogenase
MASVMPAPPLPFVPPERHGEIVVMALMCFAGPADEAQAALAPFRELADPIADMVRPIPYPEIYGPVDPDYHPAAIVKNLYLDAVDAPAAATILDFLERSDAPMRVFQLRPLGGAIARVAADATAYAHRDARIMANVASFYAGADDKPARQAWVDELSAALPRASHAAYVNFLGDEGPERVRAAYPGATWDRLAAIKARYDPDNLFRNTQNIPPGG